MEKKPHPPGAHGTAQNFRRKMSDYKRQLVEKQKLRAQYNIAYLTLEKAKLAVTVIAEPQRETIPVIFGLSQVVEFYSR